MAETAVPARSRSHTAARARSARVDYGSLDDAPAPDVIVVGAGLAGLMAGCLLARAGRRVEVHEQHYAPGGYATTFERRARDGTRYVFDVSLHSVGGLDTGGLVRQNLERCGVWADLDPVRLPHQYRWICGGEDIRVPQGDVDAYVSAMAGGDADAAADLVALAEEIRCTVEEYRRLQDRHFVDLASNARAYQRVIRHSRLTQRALLERFIRDPRVRDRVASQWAYQGVPPSRLPAIAFMAAWAEYMFGGAYYLDGGGERLVAGMVRRIEECGGRVHVRSPVRRVLVERGRAVGVELADGRRRAAECVVANVSPAALAEHLLESGTLPPEYAGRVAALRPSLSCFGLYLGLDRPVAEIGGPEDYMIVDAPVADAEELYARAAAGRLEECEMTIVAHDAVAPDARRGPGGRLAVAVLTASASWMTGDRAAYRARKAAATDAILSRLERHVPGVRAHVRVLEAATPRTNVRYTRNPGGAIYGYEKDVTQASRVRGLSRTPIDGLYLASAWTFPGGGYSGALWAGYYCVYENGLLPAAA